ncbi:RadC family protein [Vibrio parahaemolyticus]|uniref:RadC family protein n=1 Tax=Vibrio parahaemolyticus TaxID=670 RepID=UPI003D64F37D
MTFSLEVQEGETENIEDSESSVSAAYSDSGLFTGHEQAVLEEAATILKSKLCIGEQPALSSPEMVKNFCRYSLAAREHEVFGCIFLDNQHRVRSSEELFTGTVNAASVYPREVVKKALAENASAVIFYHNHPSGVAEPSQADRRITRRLIDALALIDVLVLDHFVVSFEDTVSFAERGWI